MATSTFEVSDGKRASVGDVLMAPSGYEFEVVEIDGATVTVDKVGSLKNEQTYGAAEIRVASGWRLA